MADLESLYYIVEILVGATALAGVAWGVYKWLTSKREPKRSPEALPKDEDEKIACSNCQTVFTPKWRERETLLGGIEEYAVCPQCGEENAFEVEEDEEEEEE